MTPKEETEHLRPKGCICDPFDLAALGHMTNCPARPIKSQPRNEISVRRQAAQIAQRRMWGE
jgi:hypothetical protein